MPRVRVTLPDELLQRAATRAQELGKHIEALAKHVKSAPAADSALNQGHDVPSGARRPEEHV